MRTAFLFVAAGALVSCRGGGGPSFPLPFTAQQMAQAGGGRALAHYLSQPDATAEVCSRTSKGPHVGPMSSDDIDDLLDGLIKETVPPAMMQTCAKALLATATTPDEASTFLDAMGRAYKKILRDSDLETGAHKPQLDALHQIYLLRPNGREPHADVMADLTSDLRAALAKGKFGPIGTRYGEDLIATLDLERGLWKGQPVTAAALDDLQAKNDEPLLRRFAARLRDPALQTEAKRRVVRLHIAASTSPEVKQLAAEIEAQVVATGRFAVDLAKHAPVKGSLTKLQVRAVQARQDVWKQSITLFAYAGDRPGDNILPELDLRGGLQIELEGLSKPVTLCGPPEDLDVTPCVLPTSLKMATPIVYLDEDGRFHLVERLSSRDAAALMHDQVNITFPITLAGKELVTVDWPIVFERPQSLFFRGAPGARGLDLVVRAEQRDPLRMVFTVDGAGASYVAIVETPDAPSFSIVTRGGDGLPGAPGSNGVNGIPGRSGSPAVCPSGSAGPGGDGTPGGDGGPGYPGNIGGAGGDVQGQIVCTGGDCAGFAALAQRIVQSQGGPGGPGGPGGRGGFGGSGGAGGPAATCAGAGGQPITLPGGAPGNAGRNGSSGAPGATGREGPPGRVALAPGR